MSYLLLFAACFFKSKLHIDATLTKDVLVSLITGIVVKVNILGTEDVNQIALGSRVMGIVTVLPENVVILIARVVQQEIVT